MKWVVAVWLVGAVVSFAVGLLRRNPWPTLPYSIGERFIRGFYHFIMYGIATMTILVTVVIVATLMNQ